jgi:hypothetical protein
VGIDLAIIPGEPLRAFFPVPRFVPVPRFLRLRTSLLSDARSKSDEHGKRGDRNTDDRCNRFESHVNSSSQVDFQINTAAEDRRVCSSLGYIRWLFFHVDAPFGVGIKRS